MDIKLTPGGALKIFLNGEFEGGLGFYRLEDHVRYAEKVDDKINYEVQRGFLAFAQLRGRAGIKFFDRVALGAVGGVGIQTPGLYENIYGGELRVQITKNFSINANATVTNRKSINSDVLDMREVGGKLGSEKIIQATGGLRLDF